MSLNSFAIQDLNYEIRMRFDRRSKHIKLRLDPLNNTIVATMPPGTPEWSLINFLNESRPWLIKRSQEKVDNVPFADKSVIPIFGQPCTLNYIYSDHPRVIRGKKDHINMPA